MPLDAQPATAISTATRTTGHTPAVAGQGRQGATDTAGPPQLDAQPTVRLDRRRTAPSRQERNDAPCCGNAASNWCVVQTHTQAERWANANLRRAGYVTYLPMAVVRRRDNAIRSLWHRVEVPLFPGYLFLQHANRDLWRPIRELPGVLAVLRTGDRIHHVRAGVLEAVQAALADAEHAPRHEVAWKPGAPCSLVLGPLAGHPAVVLATHRDTATIGVLLFGALRQVQAPVAWLVARD